MYCQKCGTIIPDHALYCEHCGHRVFNSINHNADTLWYYLDGSVQVGPVSSQAFEELITSNTIQQDTLVWTNGLQTWIPASQSVFSSLFSTPPTTPAIPVSEKWIWALSTVPLLLAWITPHIISQAYSFANYAPAIVAVILNIILLSCDIGEVRRNNLSIDSWLWLGIVLVPVYIYVREDKTNKNYAPLIVWCILFAIDLFVMR